MLKITPKRTKGGVSFRKKLTLKVRRMGVKKPIIEQVHGHDLHRNTGKWNILHRVINRKNNLYHKIIEDGETGEIIHECKESLSAHQGHGAAKSKGEKFTKR